MLIFYSGLIHSGAKNTSDKRRFSLDVTFHEIVVHKFAPKASITGLENYNQHYGTNF
ncbi:hypothetical protein AQEC111735_10275 [Aquirufa ecclesiirivi]